MPREILLIVNPRSGVCQGLQVLGQVRNQLHEAGIETHSIETTAPGHATQIARETPLQRYMAVGVIGGDGTLHEVLNGLLSRPDPPALPVAVFPGGTGNTVMEHLQCLDPLQVVRHVVAGQTCPIDIARVEMADQIEYCCNIVGWGVVTDINATAERLRWLRTWRYTAATLLHMIAPRVRRVRLTIDGQSSERELLFVLGCNTRTTGRGMIMAPRADIADGRLDLILVRNAPRRQLLRMFQQVFQGQHLQADFVESYQARELEIIPEQPSGLNLDGELRGCAPCRVTMLPRVLSLFGQPRPPSDRNDT